MDEDPATGRANQPETDPERGGHRRPEVKDYAVFAQGLEGIGQPGRLNHLEERVARHERTVQRMKGVGGGFSVLFTVFHVALDLLKR